MDNLVPASGAAAPSANLVTKEAARLLGLSHRTLEDWRLKGGGPRYLKFGRRVLYRLSDLMEFMESSIRWNTGHPGLS